MARAVPGRRLTHTESRAPAEEVRLESVLVAFNLQQRIEETRGAEGAHGGGGEVVGEGLTALSAPRLVCPLMAAGGRGLRPAA